MAAWSVLMAGIIFVTETESSRLFEISRGSLSGIKSLASFGST